MCVCCIVRNCKEIHVYVHSNPKVYEGPQCMCMCPISFPREWIKGDEYPAGIDRNMELSPRDKEHVRRLYGPPRVSPGNKSLPPPISTQPQKSKPLHSS